MSDPGQAARWIRIACWMVGGAALGGIAGEISDALKTTGPRYHRAAEVMVVAGDQPGEETHLSVTHAAIALRNFALRLPSGETRDEPETLCENVRIRAEKNGTRITVDIPESGANLEIAGEIARVFRGIRWEREVAANPVAIPPFSGTDRQLVEDALKLRGLLQSQAARAGYLEFLQILPKAINGSTKAKSIVEDEDFSRRFRRYQEISVGLGLEGLPGAPLTPPPDVVFEARYEKDPELEKNSSGSNFVSMACILLAGSGAWLTTRRKPGAGETAPPAVIPLS